MDGTPDPARGGCTPFPASRVLGFGVPLVIGMGGHALFNLVDLWIVGPLGPAALAAVTVASLVNSAAMVVMQGVTDGSVALVARAVGAGDYRRARSSSASSSGFPPGSRRAPSPRPSGPRGRPSSRRPPACR